MSLDQARIPSLKDKMREQAVATPIPEADVSVATPEDVVESESKTKGRRLNK